MIFKRDSTELRFKKRKHRNPLDREVDVLHFQLCRVLSAFPKLRQNLASTAPLSYQKSAQN